MVILLDSAIVVKQGRLRTGHDMKAVCCSRVFKIVDDGGQNGSKDFQISQPVLLQEKKLDFNK